jgi:hypothetical protein
LTIAKKLSPTKIQNKQKYKNEVKQISGFWRGHNAPKTDDGKAAVFNKWQIRNPI